VTGTFRSQTGELLATGGGVQTTFLPQSPFGLAPDGGFVASPSHVKSRDGTELPPGAITGEQGRSTTPDMFLEYANSDASPCESVLAMQADGTPVTAQRRCGGYELLVDPEGNEMLMALPLEAPR